MTHTNDVHTVTHTHTQIHATHHTHAHSITRINTTQNTLPHTTLTNTHRHTQTPRSPTNHTHTHTHLQIHTDTQIHPAHPQITHTHTLTDTHRHTKLPAHPQTHTHTHTHTSVHPIPYLLIRSPPVGNSANLFLHDLAKSNVGDSSEEEQLPGFLEQQQQQEEEEEDGDGPLIRSTEEIYLEAKGNLPSPSGEFQVACRYAIAPFKWQSWALSVFLNFFKYKKLFFCIFYQVNNLVLHQSYLKSPLPVKLT